MSVAAVSLGLRHTGNISEATARRIQETAKRMGYRPNPHAAALSTRSRALAHDVPLAILRRHLGTGIHLYPVEAFAQGIAQRCGELGYRTEEFVIDNDQDLPRLLQVLYNRGFQGIFLAPVGLGFQAEAYDWSKFSVLACGRYNEPSPFHTVRQEVFETTRMLMNKLVENGSRNICLALLKHVPPLIDDFARQAAAAICHPPHGRRTRVIFSESADLSDFLQAVHAEKFDSVVGFSIGHYYALLNAGFEIPEQIQFVTLHIEPDSEWSRDVSGLRVKDWECGLVAANRMDQMIRHHERGIPAEPEHITIRNEWYEGKTIRGLKSPQADTEKTTIRRDGARIARPTRQTERIARQKPLAAEAAK